MKDPYLIFGLRLASQSPEHMKIVAELMSQLGEVLRGLPVTQMTLPGVFVCEVPRTNARGLWRRVAILLRDADNDVQGDLQWFAHLSDERRAEFATN